MEDQKVELTTEEIKFSVSTILRNEADAERRTLAMIEKYQLPIDIKKAAKTMNWYLYSYQYAEKYRDWLGKDLSSCDSDAHNAVWEAMPDALSNDYETIHEEYLKLFAQTYQSTQVSTQSFSRKRAYLD